MKCYISLPITGYDLTERRETAAKIEAKLQELGFETVNPMSKGLPDDAPYSEHMKQDLKLLLDCDHIYPAKGWENSGGCRLEVEVAMKCGLMMILNDFNIQS